MLMVDQFYKMANFITCHMSEDVTYIADLFFQEIVMLHGIPRTIFLIGMLNFLSDYWRSMWSLMRTKLLFSTTCDLQTDRQMEMINRTLITLLTGIVSKSLRD